MNLIFVLSNLNRHTIYVSLKINLKRHDFIIKQMEFWTVCLGGTSKFSRGTWFPRVILTLISLGMLGLKGIQSCYYAF